MNKKLLYIWKSPYPWDVRVEKICNTFAEGNFDVHILARWGGEPVKRERIGELNIIRAGFHQKAAFSTPVPFNPFWINAIESAIKEVKPDLIIVREIMLAEDAGRIARSHKIPILMDMAENYPAAMREWKKYNHNPLSKFLVRTIALPSHVEKRAVKLMDGIITVCKEQNIRLENIYGIYSENMVIAHNTPYLGTFVRKDKNFSTEKIVLGHHGYHTAEKSIMKFLQTFVNNEKDLGNLEIQLAGSGDEIPDFKRIAVNSKKVKFLGEYKPANLPIIIAGFHIGLMTYQINPFNETTIHNKIFDYFAAGIPVIVSEAAPSKRLIEETRAGIVINCENPKEIKEQLLKLKDYPWIEYSENAYRAFRRKYNWENDGERVYNFVKRYL
jgi:glycosyltransferase involved in cell wall biosynthesis